MTIINNELGSRCYDFATEIEGLCRLLEKKENDFELSEYLIKSAEQIKSSLVEIDNAVVKLSVALKETKHFLFQLNSRDVIAEDKYNLHCRECKDLDEKITRITERRQ